MKKIVFCLTVVCSIQQMLRAGDIYTCPRLLEFWHTEETTPLVFYSIIEMVGYIEDIKPCPPPRGGQFDPILGYLLPVYGGTFTQGNDIDPCHSLHATPFTHTLTRDILVMETEVSRQMWADLKMPQSTLPSDPTNTEFGGAWTIRFKATHGMKRCCLPTCYPWNGG